MRRRLSVFLKKDPGAKYDLQDCHCEGLEDRRRNFYLGNPKHLVFYKLALVAPNINA